MSEEIIKVVDDLSARFGMAIDWGSDKALPALHELFEKLVHYKMTIHSIGIAITVLLIALCVFLVIAMKRDYGLCINSGKDAFFWDHYSGLEDVDLSIVGVFSIVTLLSTFPVSIIVCFYNIFKLVKLVVLPELCVLEYLMNLVN